MAYTSNFTGLEVYNFVGGLNESVDETLIKPNECTMIQNFNIERGTACTSPGISLYTTGTMPQQIDTIMPYYHNNTSDLLITSGGKMYKLESNGTFTQLDTGLTAGKPFDYVNFSIGEGDVIIYGNGTDNTKILNGTTVRNLKNRRPVYDLVTGALTNYVDALNNTVATADAVTTLAPKLKYIELHYERLWGAGDSANPDTIYFSTSNVHGFDPEDWTYPTAENEANQHGGFIDLPTNDGGNIIGIKVIFDDIVIFKRNNIFKIFGTSPVNYTKTQIFSANGGIADKTIVAVLNKAFFVAKDGIYQYDGTNVAPIHLRVKDTFDNINKAYIDSSVAVAYKNHYILAVPEGSSAVNNLIIDYDILHNNFTITRGFVVNSFATYNDQLLFVDNTGKIYVYGIGNTFNGTVINSYYETGFKDLGSPNSIKTSQFLYFTGSSSTNGSVKFTVTTENGQSSKTVQLTPVNKPYRTQLKVKGRVLNLRFENVNGSQIVIKSPKLLCDVDYD